MKEYIDREETLTNLKKFAPEAVTPLVEQIIMKQPAEEVAKITHGKWQHRYTKCSECCATNPTTYLDEWDFRYKAKYLPYCPHCGTKMKKM